MTPISPDVANKRTPPRKWPRFLLLFGLWSLPGLIFASLIHARMLQVGEESHLWQWLISQQSGWYAWALLTPVVVRLGRRFRIDRDRWPRNIAIHLASGLVLASAQVAVRIFASLSAHGESLALPNYLNSVYRGLIWEGPWSLLVYWAIVGISYAFDYRASLKEKELHASRLEAEISRGKLDALQRQLQPHFLFNTLNSISVLVQKGDTHTANQMLGALGDLLRYVLSRESALHVPLEEELGFVRRYTEIEGIRYGDRLRVTFDVPADTLSLFVPSFILQSLVENAIRHGVARKTDGGTVAILARRRDDRLELQVRDNGTGLPDAMDAFSGDGIGLNNARQRLTYLYGQNYRLTIHNADAGGVLAQLDIPATIQPLPLPDP